MLHQPIYFWRDMREQGNLHNHMMKSCEQRKFWSILPPYLSDLSYMSETKVTRQFPFYGAFYIVAVLDNFPFK
jgi:hypothetical protein